MPAYHESNFINVLIERWLAHEDGQMIGGCRCYRGIVLALESWKRFRWIDWAIKNGLWSEEHLNPIKCFKVVSVFRECSEHVVHRDPSMDSIAIQASVSAIETLAMVLQKPDKGEKGKGSTKGDKGIYIVKN